MDIFQRLRAGESVPFDDPQYGALHEAVDRTLRLSAELNACPDRDRIRRLLGEIFGKELDPTSTIFTPFHTNYGGFTDIGRNVFINHGCSFLDLGGITIEDHVLIGPGVHIASEGHPLDPLKRQILDVAPVRIKQNVWIGAQATILAGVTVGENAVVAAGAVVTKDVPDNAVVAGVPARIVRSVP
ncbi:MAG: DapH/DapD/GlmU-related protein [Bacteroidales bacterium]